MAMRASIDIQPPPPPIFSTPALHEFQKNNNCYGNNDALFFKFVNSVAMVANCHSNARE